LRPDLKEAHPLELHALHSLYPIQVVLLKHVHAQEKSKRFKGCELIGGLLTVRIFTHGDSDGLCAGALALAAHDDADVFFTHPYGLLEDTDRVEGKDMAIICDVALAREHLRATLARFSAMADEGGLIYIDHHPVPQSVSVNEIPGEVVHAIGASSSELTFSHFKSRLDPLLSRVAIYGAIADYLDNTPTIQELMEKWDQRTVCLETGILVQGIEGERGNYNFKREIVSNLAINMPPSFLPELVESAIQTTHKEEEILRELKKHIQVKGEVAYVLNIPFSQGKTATYTRALAGTLVGIAAEEHAGVVDLSLRAKKQTVDLNKILRKITPSLGGSGGGHPVAAGARIPKKNLSKFIDRLNKSLADRKA
jgi:RecJ-like exonuclease